MPRPPLLESADTPKPFAIGGISALGQALSYSFLRLLKLVSPYSFFSSSFETEEELWEEVVVSLFFGKEIESPVTGSLVGH